MEVVVHLHPTFVPGNHHKGLALALLSVLNDDHFQAATGNGSGNRPINVSFHEPEERSPYILGRFLLPEADPIEIQHIADQAQQYLTRRMAEAVDAFKMVLAVSTVDPYKARLAAATQQRKA